MDDTTTGDNSFLIPLDEVVSTPTSITVADGTDPNAGTTFAAGALTLLDSFTVATNTGSTTVSQMDVALTANTSLYSVELRKGADCATGTLVGTAVTSPGATASFTGLTETITNATTTYNVCAVGLAVGTAVTTVSARLSDLINAASIAETNNDTAQNLTLNAATMTVADGTDPNVGTTFSAGALTLLDRFTVVVSAGQTTATRFDVALTANTSLASVELRKGTDCTGTLVGAAVSNPTATASFTGLTETITNAATTYNICATGLMQSAAVTTVSARVSDVVNAGAITETNNDTAQNLTLNATTLTVGNGSDPVGSSISGGTTTVLDTFTLSTSASSGTVTSVTTALTGSTALTGLALWTGAGCTGTSLATATPGATPSFTALTLPVSTSSATTTYYICGTAGSPGTDTTVSINVTNFALSAGSAALQDNDTGPNFTVLAPATLTIGNGSDPVGGNLLYGATAVIDTFTLYTNTGSTTVNAVAMQLTGNAALSSLSLWTGAGCTGTNLSTISSPTGTPSFGSQSLPANNTGSSATTYYICGTAGSVAASTTVSVNVTGVTPSSGTWTYVDNDTGPNFTVPVPGTITIGTGANPNPGSANLNAGATAAMNKFTLIASTTGASATGITVNLTNGSALSAASIHTNSGCTAQVGTLGTVVNGTNVIPISFTVPTASTSYWLCATGGTVAVATAVTGTVTAVAANGFTSTGSDTTSATLTVQPTATITTTVADGTNPTPGTVGPVTTPVAIDVDAFDVSFTNGSDAITAVQVTLGTTVGIGRLAITNASNTELGFITTIGSLTPTINLTTNITAAGSYKIRVTPLAATAMPAPQGGTYSITARITDITVTNAKSVADTTSGTLTIDNWSPNAVATLSGTPGSGSVKVAWVTEPSDADFLTGGEVVVLVRQDLAPTSVPVEGVDYAGNETFVADGARVGCVTIPGQKNCTVSGLTSPNNYYFTVFARDAFHNYSVASAVLGPVQPASFVADGDLTSATKPVISIIDPMSGAVLSQPARVQVRIYSPGGAALLTGANAPKLLVDGSDPGAAVTAVGQMTAYPGSTLNVVGVWEFTLNTLTSSTAGIAHTLRATASNASGLVYSGTITVVIKTGKGDGNLLVRDNSSQLCSDCHAGAMSHSSESTGTKFGSWATTCRDCHTPHKTTNISLVKTSIKPPERTGPTTAQPVVFLNRNGLADSSFASTAKNGVCQVCHTQTAYYRADGSLATHETGAGTNCAGCHDHKKGFKGSCTNCHGTDGFTASVTGADSNIASAPPALVGPTTPTPNTPPAAQVTTGDGHRLHLNRTGFRSAPIQCADCHTNYSPTHRDGSANVSWGTLAGAQGFVVTPATGALTATFKTTPNCTNWCHGSGLKDGHGTVATWAWNSTTLADCSSCHGQTGTPNVAMPSVATAHHPQNASCVSCHGVDYATAAQVDRAPHIDGTIQKPANGCTACHGDLAGLTGPAVANTSRTSAPGYTPPASVDAHGKTATTDLGVGAHKLHMDSGMIAMDCTKCHGGTLPGDATHADGTIAIGFLAGAGVTVAPTTFTGWASPGSCTTYCHSRGEPLGTETNSASAKTWAAASYSAATCASCHGDKSTLATNAHEWHFPAGYGIECQTCHVNTATGSTGIVSGGGSHISGGNNANFDTTGDARTAGANWTSPNCSALYCHSNAAPLQGQDGKKTVAWNATAWIRSGATANECTQCHAMAADATVSATSQNLSHGHYVHTSTYGKNCSVCHNGIATGVVPYPTNAATVTATLHVNGQKNVAWDAFNNGALAYDGVAHTCSTTYCHSNGQAAVPGQNANTVAWNATLSCESCHYGNAVATNKMQSGSHTAHVVNEGYACGACHAATLAKTSDTAIVTYAKHVNGTKDVQIDASYDTTPANLTDNYTSPTCSSISCHGNGTATPTWGGSVSCGDCHLRTNVQGGDAPVYGGTFPLASSPMLSSDEWTAGGHGQVAYGFGVVNPCLYCHDNASGFGHKNANNPFRLRGPSIANGTTGAYDAANNVNAVCLNCHALGSNGVTPSGFTNVNIADTNVAKKITAEHYGAAHPPTGVNNGGKRCWDCHDGHGDGNLHMVGKNVVQTSSDNHGWNATRLSGIAFTASALGSDYAAAGSLTKICSACHTTTKYYRGVAGSTTHETGACIPCHAHQQPPSKAFTGSGACSACHMGAASATSSTDRDEFPPSTATGGATPKSLIDPEEWYGTGHGRVTTNYTQSNNPPANFPAPSPTVDPCYYCHAPDTALFTGGETSAHGDVATANPFRLLNTSGGTNPNGVCLKCHSATGGGFDPDGTGSATYGNINRTTSKAITATHYGARHSATADGGSLCWDCHDPHGDYNWTTGREIAYMIQALPLKDSSDTTGWGKSGTFVANTVDFNKATGGVTTSLDWGDYVTNKNPATTNNGVCQVCHSTTTHFKSGAWTTSPIAPDTDYDANHNTTGSPRCTGCHAHEQAPNLAFRASCTGCHGNKSATARTPAAGADGMLEYAPPTAADGTSSATTVNGVGAHISHVNQTTLRSQALACSICHGASLPAAGHPNNAVAPVNFTALATTGGITTAAYTQGTGCSATYCHGNFKNGNYQLASLPAPTAAPTGLTFSNVTARSLTLKWTKVANAFVYKVERGLGATPATWAQIGTTTAASYADGGLGQNTTYSYRVSAWNLGGYGPTATASQLTNAAGAQSTVRYDLAPATAVNLTTDGSTTITTQTSYTWSTTTTPKGMGVANYALNTTTQGRVYRNGTIAANSAYTAIMYTPALTTNPVNANLPISLDWVNRTTTTSGIGRFDATLYEYNDATGTVGQAKGTWSSPNLPQASASTTTWTTYSGTLNNPEFNITSGNRLKVVISYVTGATAPADACLLFGATEVASATAGASRGNTFITPTFGIPTETVPTAAPTGLTVTGYEANSVTLSWGAVAGATSYKVERAPASTGPWAQVGKPTTTILTDGALTANTTYWYRVYASSAAGDGTAVAGPLSQLTRLPADGKPAWTGTFTSTTTLTCGSCHGDPPGGTHPSGTNCSLCHPGYGDWAATGQVIDPAQHINGVVNMTDDCTVCHATQVGDRRNVVAEFGMKWSHKRSAGGAVNKWDCIVCHMEGDPSTGLPRNGVAGGHMDGYVNLRDPDTGNNIQNVTWNMTTSPLGGTAAGSFGPGTGDATFMAFSRDLGVAFENDPNFLKVAAIQVNQCMKCHDTNGALAFTGTLPLSTMASQPAGTTRTQYIPFGTAVSYSAIATNEGGTTTAPSGTETAGGVAGGVIRLDASFATGNSSYHPVIGRNNNSFVYGTRAVAPWNTGITGRTAGSGSVNNYGYLMSCWDCHAANGTGSVPLTGTVTAHGGATTVRGKPYVTTAPSASNSVTLCKVCHAQYESSTDNAGHLTGSAIASSVNSPMGSTYMNYGCNMCHGSGYSVAVRRPIRAEDTHGTNTLSSLGTLNTLSGRWLADPRPFAFVRNRAAIGDHQPKAIGATTYTSAQCNMAGGGGESSICSNQGLKTYTPGGKF